MINSSVVLRKNLRVGMTSLDGREATLIHSTNLSKIYFVTRPEDENGKYSLDLVPRRGGKQLPEALRAALRHHGGLPRLPADSGCTQHPPLCAWPAAPQAPSPDP